MYNPILDYIILANGREDVEVWFQILIFIFVIVFWAIGGILKSYNASKEQKKSEPSQQQPQRPTDYDKFKKQALERLRQAREKFEPIATPPRQIKRTKPVQTASCNYVKKTSESTGYQNKKAEKSKEPSEIITEVTSSITQDLGLNKRENLRKALIHFEIFSKPRAMRPYHEQ